MFLPERLKKCREQADISQEQLVMSLAVKHDLRISRATLSSWEGGDTLPDVNQLVILAEFFGKPITHFFALKAN